MLGIEDAHLVEMVEQLPENELDGLPFGVIRLDAEGRVMYLSRTEARQSGLGDRLVTGLRFFTELAPCMWTPAFQRQFDEAAAAGTLDLAFEQVGDFDDPARLLRVRARSATGGGLWLFVERV